MKLIQSCVGGVEARGKGKWGLRILKAALGFGSPFIETGRGGYSLLIMSDTASEKRRMLGGRSHEAVGLHGKKVLPKGKGGARFSLHGKAARPRHNALADNSGKKGSGVHGGLGGRRLREVTQLMDLSLLEGEKKSYKSLAKTRPARKVSYSLFGKQSWKRNLENAVGSWREALGTKSLLWKIVVSGKAKKNSIGTEEEKGTLHARKRGIGPSLRNVFLLWTRRDLTREGWEKRVRRLKPSTTSISSEGIGGGILLGHRNETNFWKNTQEGKG